MANDELAELGPMMNDIGVEGTEIMGGDPDGLYIYAEVSGGSVFAALFKDEGGAVRYFDPTDRLADLIRDAWELGDPDETKRWIVIEYEVLGTKFEASYTYSEEIDPKDYATDRRRAALKKRYGDKPVIYPPIPEHFEEFKRD